MLYDTERCYKVRYLYDIALQHFPDFISSRLRRFYALEACRTTLELAEPQPGADKKGPGLRSCHSGRGDLITPSGTSHMASGYTTLRDYHHCTTAGIHRDPGNWLKPQEILSDSQPYGGRQSVLLHYRFPFPLHRSQEDLYYRSASAQ